MEPASAGVIFRIVAEYGILGLGWILFLFSMLYIRVERARYQDLVIHIITYFTKIHMLKGDSPSAAPFPPELLGPQKRSPRAKRRFGRGADPEDDDYEALR